MDLTQLSLSIKVFQIEFQFEFDREDYWETIGGSDRS